jgi:hypothetical protein
MLHASGRLSSFATVMARELAHSREVLRTGWSMIAAIARTLGVSRASIYRNLPEPRS